MERLPRIPYAYKLTEIKGTRSFTIGVVDDDTSILESLEELLASGGHNVLLFPSAGAFLAADGHHQVDCLISDIGMPAMTGWELLRIVAMERPDLPVILITARDDERAPVGLDKAARALFRKPFDGKELLAAIRTILRPD